MENNNKIEELQNRNEYLNSQLSFYKGKCEVYEKYIDWAKKEPYTSWAKREQADE